MSNRFNRFIFQEKIPFHKREAQSERIRTEFPNHVPVIVEPCNNKAPDRVQKTKYLVPKEYPVSRFLSMLRGKISNLHRDEAIFLFTDDNSTPSASETMSRLYDQKHHEDGFLYLHYAFENAFGKGALCVRDE